MAGAGVKLLDIFWPVVVWLSIASAMGWIIWSQLLSVGEIIMVIGASVLIWNLYGLILHFRGRWK